MRKHYFQPGHSVFDAVKKEKSQISDLTALISTPPTFCYPRLMGFFTRALAVCLLVAPSAALAQLDPALHRYTTCKFDDGLTVAEASPLPAGVKGRTVETLAGFREVAILRGEHITFTYPGTDFFATVKVEQLPPASFDQGRKDLISNFDHILAGGDDSTRNMAFALRPRLNGFEVYGLDRKKLEGNTLGIYLLIDNRLHIVTSVFFLNQDPARRKFSTLAEYAALRDNFLEAYTSCVHAPYASSSPAKAAPAKRHR
jgi:hypothetical protein